MAAAARLPHLFGVAAASASSSSSDAAASGQNGASFSENAKQGMQPSVGFFSRAKDLCLNASMAVSSFVGSPVKRIFQTRTIGYESKSAPWIAAQSASKGLSGNNSSFILNSKKEDTAASVGNELQDSPSAVPESPPKTTALMSHVSNLIKLVNSRDIVELELKHKDYELLIRKKEALPVPPAPPAPPMPQFFPGPHVMAHTPFPTVPQEPARPSPSPVPAAPLPEEVKAVVQAAPKQDAPPMLSPMAGTFYRSPAPAEPAFVKVGDKVQKGQVVCIVEAMKLMNEIEADQSGTIVEILADDGKAVSIDTPLFAIKP